MSGWGSAADDSAKVEVGFNKKNRSSYSSDPYSYYSNSFTVASQQVADAVSSSSGWGSGATAQKATDIWRPKELTVQPKRDALEQSKSPRGSNSRKQQNSFVSEDSIASLFAFSDEEDDFPENLFGDDTSAHEEDVQAASDRDSTKKRGKRRMPGMHNFVAGTIIHNLSKRTIHGPVHGNNLKRFGGASLIHASHITRTGMCYE